MVGYCLTADKYRNIRAGPRPLRISES